MEREAFEDEEVAAVLNKGYVSIKVDREERPDIDNLYMNICQAMTGQGGWPLTILMTPDKKPFFSGTYFPKHSRYGMPGLIDILTQVHEIWNKEPGKLVEAGQNVVESIKKSSSAERQGELEETVLARAYEALTRSYDESYGGFGSAPKFPTPHNLSFLLRYGSVKGQETTGVDIEANAIVEKTLEQMYKGGIFDHVGFGFSRYSTDKKWLVPHFEKMLYDNALLAIAYLESFQVTKRVIFKEVAEKVFTYVLRDMTSPEGAFYSAEDADSEGVEGKYYLWIPEEIREVLGPEKGELYCRIYDITPKGNFEGKSIPNLIKQDFTDKHIIKNRQILEECRKKLFKVREERIHPHKDDKILTSWNALMITALARGARILDNSSYLAAAKRAVNFILQNLRREDGRLLARYRDKEAAYLAYLDDYAFLVGGLIELYRTTYCPDYLAIALELNSQMLELFWDKEKGGFFLTGNDAEELLVRSKDVYDGAIPSGNSMAAMNMLYLAELTGKVELEEKARQLFRAFGREISDYPAGYSLFFQAYLYSRAPKREIVIISGENAQEKEEMLEPLRKEFLPHTVSLYVSPETSDIKKVVPFIKGYPAVDGKTTAYICEKQTCQAPVTNTEEFHSLLNDFGRG